MTSIQPLCMSLPSKFKRGIFVWLNPAYSSVCASSHMERVRVQQLAELHTKMGHPVLGMHVYENTNDIRCLVVVYASLPV